MEHIFKASKASKQTLLLLHGTGGNEYDLLDVAKMIEPHANILSLRGDVNENGMNRFFKRLREGVFDEEDLVMRTKQMHQNIDDFAKRYDFSRDALTAVGYSNGANIAASLIFHYKDALKKAILYHPMVPIRNITLPNLNGVEIFITAGENDPICPKSETEELVSLLKDQGASVEVMWTRNGHQLTRDEVDASAKWLKERAS